MDNSYDALTYPGVCASCNESGNLGHNVVCDHDYCVKCLERLISENQHECPRCSKDIFTNYLKFENGCLTLMSKMLGPNGTTEFDARVKLCMLLTTWLLECATSPDKCTPYRKEKLQITSTSYRSSKLSLTTT